MKAIVQNVEDIRKKALDDLKNWRIHSPDKVEYLKKQTIQVEPVIVNKNGLIIQGVHRLTANPEWRMDILDIPDSEALKYRFQAQSMEKEGLQREESLKEVIKKLIEHYTTEEGREELRHFSDRKKLLGKWERKRGFSQMMKWKISEDLGVNERTIRRYFPKEHKRAYLDKTKENVQIGDEKKKLDMPNTPKAPTEMMKEANSVLEKPILPIEKVVEVSQNNEVECPKCNAKFKVKPKKRNLTPDEEEQAKLLGVEY